MTTNSMRDLIKLVESDTLSTRFKPDIAKNNQLLTISIREQAIEDCIQLVKETIYSVRGQKVKGSDFARNLLEGLNNLKK